MPFFCQQPKVLLYLHIIHGTSINAILTVTIVIPLQVQNIELNQERSLQILFFQGKAKLFSSRLIRSNLLIQLTDGLFQDTACCSFAFRQHFESKAVNIRKFRFKFGFNASS